MSKLIIAGHSSGSSLPPIASALVTGSLLATPLLAAISPSPSVVALSGLTLVWITLLLWRSDEPPLLLLPVLFQWSEVAAFPLATIWKQVPVDELGSYGANLEVSAGYGFAGVAALALGLRVASATRGLTSFAERLQAEALRWPLNQVLSIGLGAMGLGYALAALWPVAGSAREIVGNAAGIKHVGVFLISYWCQVNSRNYGLLAGVVGFEIVFGMTGFFADFKNSILTLLVATMAARPRLRPSDVMAAGFVAALLLFVATFWTAIKVDYRNLLNQGTGAQTVEVSLDERLGFILRAVGELDGAKLADGFDRLVARHGYIEYLALVMQNVPAVIPHEGGQLTLDVISHITMPRLFFPDKPPLPSDTEVMAKYAGLSYTWDSNTSISIGNLGELYIDFGLLGGLVAEFVIGFLIAFVYRVLRNNLACPALLSAGFCVMTVLPIAYFGTAYIKLIGSFVLTSALAILMQRIIGPRSTLFYSSLAPPRKIR